MSLNWTIKLVGMAGFEPATTYPPDKCATKLRYIPTLDKQIFLLKRNGFV
jgi:hypothetical protein